MEAAQARLSLHLSKCHIAGNHMSQFICFVLTGNYLETYIIVQAVTVHARLCRYTRLPEPLLVAYAICSKYPLRWIICIFNLFVP